MKEREGGISRGEEREGGGEGGGCTWAGGSSRGLLEQYNSVNEVRSLRVTGRREIEFELMFRYQSGTLNMSRVRERGKNITQR